MSIMIEILNNEEIEVKESSKNQHIIKELQKAEAVLDMFEQCYIGQDFSEFGVEERERFDSALCLLHDQVCKAIYEMKMKKA